MSLTNSTHGASTRVRTTYWFNPNSFAPETPGVIGNSGENFFHGPGLNNWTVGIYKDTKITESTKIELRFEFFNFFNHTQFTSANIGPQYNWPLWQTGVLQQTNANLGRYTAAATPRQMSMSLRLQF